MVSLLKLRSTKSFRNNDSFLSISQAVIRSRLYLLRNHKWWSNLNYISDIHQTHTKNSPCAHSKTRSSGVSFGELGKDRKKENYLNDVFLIFTQLQFAYRYSEYSNFLFDGNCVSTGMVLRQWCFFRSNSTWQPYSVEVQFHFG